MENVKQFLEQAQLAVEERRINCTKQAKTNAPDFRLYDFMCQDENTLSKCIKMLLDIKGKHGQGTLFLELFFKIILPSVYSEINKSSLENSKVSVEWITDNGRYIDIYIELDGYGVIAIENKPWANDQKDQLKDYASYVQKDCNRRYRKGRWLLLYLCNSEPSEYSIDSETKHFYEDSGNFRTIGFDKVVDWLSECALYTEAAKINVFIEELKLLVDEKVNRNMKQADHLDLFGFIKYEADVETLFSVLHGMKYYKHKMLLVLKDDLRKALDAGLILEWNVDDEFSRYCGFSIKIGSCMEEAFTLCFEFQSSNLNGMIWGITRNSEEIPNSPNRWNNIHESMQEKFGNANQSLWWPWWKYADDGRYLKGYRDWEYNYLPWAAIQNGSMVNEIAGLAREARELFLNNEFLSARGL
mgnify:CR=1 FL=1